MTVTSSPAIPADDTDHRSSASEQARMRRARRHARMASVQSAAAEPLLHRARRSAQRVPFVAVLVVLLGAGLAGALWLNTLTDEAGIRTAESRRAGAALQLEIEQLSADIAARDSTPAIAAAARALGMVPAGDSAILLVPDDGGPAVLIGTPTPAVDPVAVAAEAARVAAEQEAARVAAEAARVAAEQEAARVAAETAPAADAGPAPAAANPVGATTIEGTGQ